MLLDEMLLFGVAVLAGQWRVTPHSPDETVCKVSVQFCLLTPTIYAPHLLPPTASYTHTWLEPQHLKV